MGLVTRTSFRESIHRHQQLRFFRHLHSSSTALGNFEFKSYSPQVSDRERARTEKLQTTRSGQAIAALENPSLKIYLLP